MIVLSFHITSILFVQAQSDIRSQMMRTIPRSIPPYPILPKYDFYGIRNKMSRMTIHIRWRINK